MLLFKPWLPPRQLRAGRLQRSGARVNILRTIAVGLALVAQVLVPSPASSEVSAPAIDANSGLTLGETNYLPQNSAIADTALLLDLSDRTLYVYNRGTVLNTFAVAIGREGWETPTGRFTVFQMQQNPVWEHPFTGELVPAGDTNPLGHRWIGFWSDGTNAIGFHGTPQESSIGQAVSHGCVRLHNRDVVTLYEHVAIGTPVYVTP